MKWPSILRLALVVLLVLAAPSPAGGAHLRARDQEADLFAAPSPMRRVITMLQAMQDKIGEEQVVEKGMFDTYMCYCQTSQAQLDKSIALSSAKIPQCQSDIQSSAGQVGQLKLEIIQHKKDLKAANDGMSQATSIRNKNEATFMRTKAESETNIAALKKAIKLIGKGMKGAFLQTTEADVLRRLARSGQLGDDELGQKLAAYLSVGSSSTDADADSDQEDQGEGYAPRSGEILGVMTQLLEDMQKDLKDAIKENKGQKKAYEQLMTAKGKEASQSQKAIEQKLKTTNELKLLIVNLQKQLKDAKASLKEDTAFLLDLKKRCTHENERWAERERTRTAELGAIADTIQFLNNDEAKKLWGKTMATSGTSALETVADSFLQVGMASKDQQEIALRSVLAVRDSHQGSSRFEMDLLALALRGKKVSFAKVIKMIDTMVALLLKEQAEDDKKRAFCKKEISTNTASKKLSLNAIKAAKAVIAETKNQVKSLKAEIAVLVLGIKNLDASVAAATAQRQKENKEFQTARATNSASQEVLQVARARLKAFYDSEQYKAAGKAKAMSLLETGEDEAMSFVQTGEEEDEDEDIKPKKAPNTFGGYKGQGKKSGGVIGLIDTIKVDLAKEIVVMQKSEDSAQKDYEQMLRDSKTKRRGDAKAMADKEGIKAGTEETLHLQGSDKKEKQAKLKATMEYLAGIHKDCDIFLKKYKTVATARATEADAMKKAKAILMGVKR